MTRRSRGETRQLIVDTGVRLLLERGLEGGCDHVGMADVLSEIRGTTGQRITNASVYGRIWANQAEFHRDLLVEAAGYFPNGEEQAAADAAREVLADADLSTEVGCADALREFCRVAGAAHSRTMVSSRAWQTWLAIWAITVSTPTLDDDAERGPAIGRRHQQAVERFGEVLADVLPRVGHQLRPELTLDQLAMAVYALSEGLALHDQFAPPDLAMITLHSGPEGASQQWTLFGLGLEAILGRFVVPYRAVPY